MLHTTVDRSWSSRRRCSSGGGSSCGSASASRPCSSASRYAQAVGLDLANAPDEHMYSCHNCWHRITNAGLTHGVSILVAVSKSPLPLVRRSRSVAAVDSPYSVTGAVNCEFQRLTLQYLRTQALGASLGDNPALRRSRELREDLRDRWETSDSPLVHRIQVGCRIACRRSVWCRQPSEPAALIRPAFIGLGSREGQHAEEAAPYRSLSRSRRSPCGA